MSDTSGSSAVTLISGESGSGKSSLIASLAIYVKKRFGKLTRLATCDGGGYPTRVQALIEAGIIQVWRLDSRWASGGEGLLEETLHKASQGWWPEAGALDYSNGQSLPGCKLVAPISTSYKMWCGAGHLLKEVTSASALTPTQCVPCSKMVTLQQARVEQVHSSPAGFSEVGAVAFEGITSWSDAQLGALADRRARQELHGEKSSIGRFVSGEMALDGNNRADYGFAQTQAEKWVRASRAIPNLVIPPVWTGLESRSEETGQLGVTWCPAIAGQAKGAKVPQWVGHWVGTQVCANEAGKREWRLYLSEFRGADGIPHRYKVRTDPGVLPEYLVDEEGKPFGGFNLGVFFELLESATAKSLAAIRAEFPDAPGVRVEERAVSEPQTTTHSSVPTLPGAGLPGGAPPTPAPTGPKIPGVSIPGVRAPQALPAVVGPAKVSIGGRK